MKPFDRTFIDKPHLGLVGRVNHKVILDYLKADAEIIQKIEVLDCGRLLISSTDQWFKVKRRVYEKDQKVWWTPPPLASLVYASKPEFKKAVDLSENDLFFPDVYEDVTLRAQGWFDATCKKVGTKDNGQTCLFVLQRGMHESAFAFDKDHVIYMEAKKEDRGRVIKTTAQYVEEGDAVWFPEGVIEAFMKRRSKQSKGRKE